MEPNHNTYAPSGELPQPEQAPGTFPLPEQAPGKPEVVGLQMPISTPHQQPQAADPVLPSAQLPAHDPSTVHQPHTAMATPIADDADLIEKEWVTRAKAIVMHTKDDPHLQNKEINKVKADYMKKRYNKDLKLNET